eukprot:gene36067-44481_t
MWLEGLMPYIAGQPYRTGSTYRKKVLETSAAKGEVAGQVVQGEIATWHQPQPNNPLRFGGKVYVLIGPATYSSAVLFANTVQDFGMATLAGSGSAARSAQSGGVRKFVLPNTGLALWMPRFVLDPPAGVRGDGLLRPDIVLPQNPYREDAQQPGSARRKSAQVAAPIPGLRHTRRRRHAMRQRTKRIKSSTWLFRPAWHAFCSIAPHNKPVQETNMSISKNTTRAIPFAIAAAFAASAGFSTAASAQEVVRLGNLKFAHYGAVSYIKEIAPKCGIKVEEHIFAKGPDVMQAILAGELDVGATASEAAIQGRANGAPIYVVAGFAKGGARLVARPDGGIKSIKDLKGKKVGVTRGGIHEVLLAAELQQAVHRRQRSFAALRQFA